MFDLPTVLQAVLETAARLCDATICILFNRIGDKMHMGAQFGCSPEMVALFRANTLPIDRSNIAGRAAFERATIHVPDITQDPEFRMTQSSKLGGWRSIIAVPLFRDGEVIGVLDLARPETGPFTARQIEMVESFAAQAVIAINNASLFSEVQARTAEVTEALEYQTATSDVLDVISRSPNDLEPVLDAILMVAARLCRPDYAFFAMRDPIDGLYRVARTHNASSGFIDYLRSHPIAPGEGTCIGRTALTARTVHIADTQVDDSYAWKEAARNRRLSHDAGRASDPRWRRPRRDRDGRRQAACVHCSPDRPAGDFRRPGRDRDGNNTRLFEELQARTAEVEETLEQQKASAEILGVISRSVEDTQPVFDKILDSCERLIPLTDVSLLTVDDDLMVHIGAVRGRTG